MEILRRSTQLFLIYCLLGSTISWGQINPASDLGYRGIWFELGQKYPYGDKYSGGLGTYTAKHRPLAAYDSTTNCTYFVYGGSPDSLSRHLLCMIGCYDHATGMVQRPKVVHDKLGIDDPHDNPSIMIDSEGYIWVFVSGRGTVRPGYKYRSAVPRSIERFQQISTEEMTYPQPWYLDGFGYFHFFTKYSGVRELYYETSKDGFQWTSDRKLSGIVEHGQDKAGHYQVSAASPHGKVGTFFSRHRFGHPDQRTDLYYVESTDFGDTWQNAAGRRVQTPINKVVGSALVKDFATQGKNVYLKDMRYDSNDFPVCLYLTSNGHIPGPTPAPYQWQITRWDGAAWKTTALFQSDHNYDMGSFIQGSNLHIVAPSAAGPQLWAGGGEIEIWESLSIDTWERKNTITKNSRFNHSYIRSVLGGKPPFRFFWANGDGHHFSRSNLYFGDLTGKVWRLPYTMNRTWEYPVRIH
ncbi:MAG: BNR repeat-containing protein [Saprospiraceae bacterium]|nr:BNR repeat-containing protein [Saprospiraceae bacterium]